MATEPINLPSQWSDAWELRSASELNSYKTLDFVKAISDMPVAHRKSVMEMWVKKNLTVLSDVTSETIIAALHQCVNQSQIKPMTPLKNELKQLFRAAFKVYQTKAKDSQSKKNTVEYKTFQQLRDYAMSGSSDNAPTAEDFQTIIGEWLPQNFWVIRDARSQGSDDALSGVWLVPIEEGQPNGQPWVRVKTKNQDLLIPLSRYTDGWVPGAKLAKLLESTISSVAMQLAKTVRIDLRPTIMTQEALYYHLGHERMMRWSLDGDTVRVAGLFNGDDGVFFRPTGEWLLGSETGEQLWDFAINGGEPESGLGEQLSAWMKRVTESSMRPTDGSRLSPQDQFVVLIAWMVNHLSRNRIQEQGIQPLLVFIGEPGAGKTVIARLILKLLNAGLHQKGVDVTPLSQSGKGAENVETTLTNRPMCVLDNLDQRIDYVPPMLESATTGGTISKRELYSDNTLLDFEIISSIMVTSADLSWLQGRPATVQRMLPITVRGRHGEYGQEPLDAEAWDMQFPLMLLLLSLATRRALKPDISVGNLPIRVPEWAGTLYHVMATLQGIDVDDQAQRDALDVRFAELIQNIDREQTMLLAEYDRLAMAVAVLEDGEYKPDVVFQSVKAGYEAVGEAFPFRDALSLMKAIHKRASSILAWGVQISSRHTRDGRLLVISRQHLKASSSRYITHALPASRGLEPTEFEGRSVRDWLPDLDKAIDPLDWIQASDDDRFQVAIDALTQARLQQQREISLDEWIHAISAEAHDKGYDELGF